MTLYPRTNVNIHVFGRQSSPTAYTYSSPIGRASLGLATGKGGGDATIKKTQPMTLSSISWRKRSHLWITTPWAATKRTAPTGADTMTSLPMDSIEGTDWDRTLPAAASTQLV